MLEAKGLITKGAVYQLGRVYQVGMPMVGSRHYSIRIPQTFAMPGKNEAVYHDEVISGELGQMGTQFDGLGHVGIGELFYNGNRRIDFAKPEGLMRLGIENVGPIVTRGVLIDVARFKGVDQLPPTSKSPRRTWPEHCNASVSRSVPETWCSFTPDGDRCQ